MSSLIGDCTYYALISVSIRLFVTLLPSAEYLSVYRVNLLICETNQDSAWYIKIYPKRKILMCAERISTV